MANDQNRPNIAEEVGDMVFFSEMVKFFTLGHAAKFFGYCVLLGAAWRPGEPKTVAVERLCKLGFSRSTGYQFLHDLERFKLHLQEKHSRQDVTEQEILLGACREVVQDPGQIAR